MKKYFLLTLFLIINLTLTGFADGHTLKTDKQFGLILHIDPNEEPVARELSNIKLLFTQMPNNFDPSQGSCIVEIYKSDQLIYQQDVFKDLQSVDDIHFNFTFPDLGIYKIKVIGKPDQSDSFQSFNFNYDLRVEKSAKSDLLTNHSNIFLLIGGLFLLLLISVIIIYNFLSHAKKTAR